MPSPLGHAMAGIAAGWAVSPPYSGETRFRTAALVATYAVAGMFPDIDLAFESHSGPTHGLGAAVIAGAATMLVARRVRWRPGSMGWLPLGLAVALAYATHTLLDWLGTDTSAPIGIMALWPFSRDYYESSLHLFMAISRRYWLPEFWTYNLRAIGKELVVLVPILVVIIAGRTRRATPLSNAER